jgi:hypothetical protein
MFSGEKYLEVDREPSEDRRAITDGSLWIGTEARLRDLMVFDFFH